VVLIESKLGKLVNKTNCIFRGGGTKKGKQRFWAIDSQGLEAAIHWGGDLKWSKTKHQEKVGGKGKMVQGGKMSVWFFRNFKTVIGSEPKRGKNGGGKLRGGKIEYKCYSASRAKRIIGSLDGVGGGGKKFGKATAKVESHFGGGHTFGENMKWGGKPYRQSHPFITKNLTKRGTDVIGKRCRIRKDGG